MRLMKKGDSSKSVSGTEERGTFMKLWAKILIGFALGAIVA